MILQQRKMVRAAVVVELEDACSSSYEPAIFMDSEFLVDAALEMLRGGGSVAV